MLEIFPQTGTVGVLSSEEKGTRLAGWVARGSGAGGSRSLDGWHAALELGARGVWVLDGWHAAQELGARGFGWLARGSGAGGPQMDGWHAAQELDGWHAHVAEELGARRGPRRWVARGSGTGAMVVTFSIRATTVFSHVPSNGTELVRFSGCKLLVAVFNPPPHHPSFSRHWFRRTSRSRVLSVLCFFTGPTLRQRECRHAERQMPVKWPTLQSLAQTRTGFQLDDAANGLAMTSNTVNSFSQQALALQVTSKGYLPCFDATSSNITAQQGWLRAVRSCC